MEYCPKCGMIDLFYIADDIYKCGNCFNKFKIESYDEPKQIQNKIDEYIITVE